MCFQYSAEDRYLIDKEFIDKIKEEQRRKIASFILRIILVPIIVYLSYSIDITQSETGKLYGLLMLSMLGLMLPIFLVKAISLGILFILKLTMLVTNIIIYVINKLTKLDLPTDSGNELATEDYFKLLILVSYIIISSCLLWFTFFEIENENYRTIVATTVSILYGSAISKFLDPLLLIAGFDIEILKKRKKKNDK
ncbi:hypothetical protein BKK51_07360 [Rodentibacter trehalosifermentans]|uniref:Uncharacterized protein n=2 Tax=Rodentibacter trehalosifermentans TaxID=1908263 RepID=A0A1V3ISQ3_9PAST|nr:hypothetical protein [Rodentibacter trehalosifermentans]OOF45121.1 hypothetical protein BKK51_07360 [Rodentibacter trehalosifermentans]